MGGRNSIIIRATRMTNSTHLAIVHTLLQTLLMERGQSRDFSFGVNHNNPDEYHRVSALTDGSLRFTFVPRDTEIQTYWPRQVACLALEVSPRVEFTDLGNPIMSAPDLGISQCWTTH